MYAAVDIASQSPTMMTKQGISTVLSDVARKCTPVSSMSLRGWTSGLGKATLGRRNPTRSTKYPATACITRNTSSSAYTTAFLDVIKDVGHPARHLSYPKAIPLYEQLNPVLSVRHTKSLLFLTALAVFVHLSNHSARLT